jgi:hypothetical protein
MAAIFDDITKEACDKSFVDVIQDGGDDVTDKLRVNDSQVRSEGSKPHLKNPPLTSSKMAVVTS